MTSKKDLSRELCEICVIERKGKLIFKKRDWDKKTYICSGHGYKEFDFKSIPEAAVDIVPTKDYKETNGFLYPYSDIERIKEEYDKNGYDFVEFRQRTINFTQPENFIKLLNFYYRFFQGVDICAFEDEVRELEARGEQISIQNDFLAMLIFDLQNREHGFNLDINFEVFTQAIRETEWVYE